MIINTTQLKNNDDRKIKNLFDITIKSAHSKIGKFFAPTWQMVNDLKMSENEYDWFQYCIDYNKLMYNKIINDKNSILEFLIKNGDEITLGCYCQEGQNCHRTLAKKIIEEYCEFVGIDVNEGIFIK